MNPLIALLINSQSLPIENAMLVIEEYIFERTGTRVQISPKLETPQDIELFERAFTIACNYYGGHIEMQRAWVSH